MYREESITYEEVNQAIKRLKNGKAAGMDGITAEMLKCGGDVVTKWMVTICQVAWERRGCQQTGRKPSLSQYTKGSGGGGSVGAIEISISLLSIPRKVYGKVIIERVQRLTEEKSVKNKEVSEREGEVWIRYFPSGW